MRTTLTQRLEAGMYVAWGLSAIHQSPVLCVSGLDWAVRLVWIALAALCFSATIKTLER